MDVSLSLIEILAFAGLFQCVSILVYLFFRAGAFSLAFIPILFFVNLTAALYLDFGTTFFDAENMMLEQSRFWIWMALCPLSILFILQFSDLSKPVPLIGYSCLIPLGFAFITTYWFEAGGAFETRMYLFGAIAATLSLPFIWLKQNVLQNIKKESSGNERYWMILSLIGLVIFLIAMVYTLLGGNITVQQFGAIRTTIGLLFVYLSATYLFRIYPAPIKSITRSEKTDKANAIHESVLKEIRHKLEFEKVYLEPSYSRSDMAQELKIPEGTLSKLMNQHFLRSFPMVLNEFRVNEACQLLEQTDAPIKVIAEEVGFNSLASFNRVFKEEKLETASKYRQKILKEASRKIA